MEGTPKLVNPVDGDDVKYVCGLSTILVATIQEAKDRISQIEYVFCSQLYPNFQSKSKSLHNIYLEAKKEAEDEFRKKEDELLLRVEKLEFEKTQVVEENRALRIRIDELQEEVLKKKKEVDDGIKFHKSLFQMIQSKDCAILEKEKAVEEYGGKINELVVNAQRLEEKIEELEKLLADSMKRVEFLSLKLADSEKILSECEAEKETLSCKLKYLEDDVSRLQQNLKGKMEEIEEGKLLQAQLLRQIDVNMMEISKQKQQLEDSDNDRKWLLDKVGGLEEKMVLLQKKNLSHSGKEAQRNDSCQHSIEKMELTASELLAEKKNYRELMDRYKSLKSQYNFLLAKSGLNSENMVPRSRSGDISESKHQDSASSHEQQRNASSDASAAAFEGKVKVENEDSTDGSGDNKMAKSYANPSFNSPTSGYIQPKCLPTAKSAPIIGIKRPASRWVETRSRECRDGRDPHDDFLATPLENLRTNLNKAIKEEVDDFDVPVQNDANVNGSDDETQDMDAAPNPEKQKMPVPMAGKKGFKYVEPVRKKAERENLKGVECKQCKKFYDAVLPDNGGNGANSGKQSLRCEHHDGVSRHRYKYAPPLTPEGFWNIGFESEM